MKITIAHMYPDLLNLYGDTGNITAFLYRLKKRGIESEVIEYSLSDEVDFENTDIFFVGGGSDRELRIVCEKMREYKDKIISYAENGGCILAVCGGFQILGKSYNLKDEVIEGIGLLDITAGYCDDRLIGDVVIESDVTGGKIVGFENHAGRMNLNNHKPLGKVLYGNGNDGKSGFEGVIYKNVIGSYLHGPLLPKNPALTDYILQKAIEKRYGSYSLEKLDDTLEEQAHDYIVKKLTINK